MDAGFNAKRICNHRIGQNRRRALARQAVEKGCRVVGFTRHGVTDELIHAGVTPAGAIADLSRCLSRPRIVLLYVPAGPAVDEIIVELEVALSEGDVVVDGGNSYW